MRRRRGTFLFVAILLGTAVVGWLSTKPIKPAISIELRNYEFRTNGFVIAHVRITNTGQIAVRTLLGFEEGWLRVETPDGWKTRNLGTSGWLQPAQMLKPNENVQMGIGLGSNATHWRIGYKVRTASPRMRIVARVPGKWRPQAERICASLFSDQPGEPIEVWSETFDAGGYAHAHESRAREIDLIGMSDLPALVQPF